VPHLYDLSPEGTGMLCLQGIAGDMVVLSWLYGRAAHWVLDRNGVRGRFGTTLLVEPTDDDEDDDGESAEAQSEEAEPKERVVDQRPLPARTIWSIDLRVANTVEPYVEELRRIARETSTQTVDLMGWIGGSPKPEQLDRYLHSPGNGNGNTADSPPTTPATASNGAGGTNGKPAATLPQMIHEETSRRWYPVIDFGRCTNCMECIDFCLFGVYGVDNVETILVEQADNCRKGCPACSRVCPENAIIFPQHKTPTIAGSPEVAGTLKIDLSQLFGAPVDDDPVATAVRERDEQLVAAGRQEVGMSVGVPKRQEGREQGPKDELDGLIDELDGLDL
jgi:hypothetical protein